MLTTPQAAETTCPLPHAFGIPVIGKGSVPRASAYKAADYSP